MTKPHLVPYVMQGDIMITSGQLAFNDAGKIEGDVAAQTRRIIAILEGLVGQEGFTLKDIGKTTVWLRSQNDFAAFNEAYAAAFGDHMPARSTTVAGLALPEALVEIEAIAWRRA